MARLLNKLKDFKTERNTLIRAVKPNSKDRIELEIGDAKQDDFIPQAKIKRWDNETNFSIRRDNGARTYKTEKGKVVAEGAIEDVVIYELADIGEDGGLEIEIHLKEKPDTNIFDFTLQTKGLNFFYQPPLTPEDIADGMSAPENVIGSYAVYHKTGRNNKVGGMEYKTGKAFHIYRPEAIDANGKKTWCELNITDDVLTVTAPQDFLDTATYPVVIDPTFGYTSVGAFTIVIASATSDTSSNIGNTFTLSEDALLDSLHAVIWHSAGSPETVDLRLALYAEDSAGSGSHGLLASAEQLNVTLSASSPDTDTFKTFTAASESIPAGQIILAALANGEDVASISIVLSADLTNTRNRYSESYTGAGSYAAAKAEDPWTESATSGARDYSIYATYTADTGTRRRLLIIS